MARVLKKIAKKTAASKPPPRLPTVRPPPKLPPPLPAKAKRAGKLGVVPYVVETVDIQTLKPHPRNYKGHPADQIAHIAESLKQFGVYRNVVIAKDGTLLAGHGVVEGAKSIGMTAIPVRRMELAPDDPRALKILALDNELPKFGENDDRSLAEILRDIRDNDTVGLLGTGYDDKSLAAFLMVTRPASEIKNADAAAEWVGMPEYYEGQEQIRLVISFKNVEDRARFVEQTKLTIDKTVGVHSWSTRWPFTRREDASSVRFVKDSAKQAGAKS